MNLKIHGECLSEELVLGLVRSGGDIDLAVVDSGGKQISGGLLLRITAEGYVRRYTSISSIYGLKLDPKGRVTIGPDK